MFIAIGILSILAGCFVFSQASSMIRLAQFAGSISDMGTWFGIVAICLILGGAFSVASENGSKRGFLQACVWVYGGAFMVSISHFSYGDLSIWTVVCAVLVIVFSVWLVRHAPKSESFEETVSYIDPDKVHKTAPMYDYAIHFVSHSFYAYEPAHFDFLAFSSFAFSSSIIGSAGADRV